MSKLLSTILSSVIAFTVLMALGAASVQAQYNSNNYGGRYNSGDDRNDDDDSDNNNCSGGNSKSKKDKDKDKDKGNLRILGLTTDQRLICFNESNPGSAKTIGNITGLTGGDTVLVGIDFRVQDNELYGVGNAGGVYRINTSTAEATFVNRTTIALNGTFFGVDFNPAADRLRIISDTGQNLRHNVNAGGTTILDGTLSYTAPATATATGVTGAAYTNNDLDPNTMTTLYDIDSNLDQVVIQSPANNGTLAATGKLTVDTNASVGFDIYSTISNGSTVNVEGFASLTLADGSVRLYSIELFSGKAIDRGDFRNQNQVTDIAIPLNQK
jgi:hypothetical protein